MISRIGLFVVAVLIARDCIAQEEVDLAMVARIKEEAYQHSQVMDTLHYLADVYGPRLAGSPAYGDAAAWAKSRLESWGF